MSLEYTYTYKQRDRGEGLARDSSFDFVNAGRSNAYPSRQARSLLYAQPSLPASGALFFCTSLEAHRSSARRAVPGLDLTCPC